MSKAKTISRDVILKAIKTEPLKNKAFVELYDADDGYVVSDDPNCHVCAVGAILRHAGMTNKQIDLFGNQLVHCGSAYASHEYHDKTNVLKTIKTNIEQKQYLHALSMKFEYHASFPSKRIGKLRKLMTKFVKENFPKRIALNPRK